MSKFDMANLYTCTYLFISVFNQLDAQSLFDNKFYFMPLHVSSTSGIITLGVMIPEAV